MSTLTVFLLLAAARFVFCAPYQQRVVCTPPPDTGASFYDFTMNDVYNAGVINFREFRNSVVLVVNVATYCGLTPQYHGLNELMDIYSKSNEFVVVGIPCNQFGGLEPGNNGTEIVNGVKFVRPMVTPLFDLTEKSEVNGGNQHPLYRFLKSYCPSTFQTFFNNLYYDPKSHGDIQWNFEKFLVGKDGHVKFRYHPFTEPSFLKADIEAELDCPPPKVD